MVRDMPNSAGLLRSLKSSIIYMSNEHHNPLTVILHTIFHTFGSGRPCLIASISEQSREMLSDNFTNSSKDGTHFV